MTTREAHGKHYILTCIKSYLSSLLLAFKKTWA